MINKEIPEFRAQAYKGGEFVPGFLASTACSLSVIVCALLPGVIKYVASGVSIVDSD